MGRIGTEGIKELRTQPELKSAVLNNTKFYSRVTMNPKDRIKHYDENG